MRAFAKLLLCVLAAAVTKINSLVKETTIPKQEKTRAMSFTKVVNHAFCDSDISEEDKMGKKTLEEVHTYAELKHDPRASLPGSFSICSTILTPSCEIRPYPTFFNILDNDRDQFLAPGYKPGYITSLLKIFYLQDTSEQVHGKIPPLFPNQWIRSCLAVNTTSGLIQWVVEGTLILTTRSEEVKTSKSRPRDLSRKLFKFMNYLHKHCYI